VTWKRVTGELVQTGGREHAAALVLWAEHVPPIASHLRDLGWKEKDPQRTAPPGLFRLAVGIGLRLSTLTVPKQTPNLRCLDGRRGPSGRRQNQQSCEELERKP